MKVYVGRHSPIVWRVREEEAFDDGEKTADKLVDMEPADVNHFLNVQADFDEMQEMLQKKMLRRK